LGEAEAEASDTGGGIGFLDNAAFGGSAGFIGVHGFDNCEIAILLVGDESEEDCDTGDEKFEFHSVAN